MKLAAIDIGSNAARLLITEVIEKEQEEPVFNKLNLFRIPIRLGFDVFETGFISEEKTYMLIQTLKAFRHLINSYHIDTIKACATSAMRDAKNSKQILAVIKKETGLDVEVISGDMEANLIYENHIAEHLEQDKTYMYIDVGGGSTEISIFSDGFLAFKKSYNLGTIRILKGSVDTAIWDEMKEDIKAFAKDSNGIISIGSGGNINKIFSMSKRKEGKPLYIETLKDYYKELGACTIEERKTIYGLRDDRADVIVPALQIYLHAMKAADSEEIFVPKIGLADGLIHHLWDEIQQSAS